MDSSEQTLSTNAKEATRSRVSQRFERFEFDLVWVFIAVHGLQRSRSSVVGAAELHVPCPSPCGPRRAAPPQSPLCLQWLSGSEVDDAVHVRIAIEDLERDA